MAVRSSTRIFAETGHEGPNVLHVVVKVLPYKQVVAGQAVSAYKAYIGAGDGGFKVTYPTRFVFAVENEDWQFHEFELGGTTWPGLAIFPHSDDFEAAFGDPDRRSVILYDDCDVMKTYRYQVVLRNRHTGELASCDPTIENGDNEKV